jgi:magnesium-protoporphyrin O-methyltransferase
MPERRPCDCGCAPNTFSDREAANDLKRYLEKGPDATTRALIDAVVREGVEGSTLLDIGGGIGAIQLELLAAGAARADAVDASEAYIVAARDEAARRGYGDRTTARVGDFVTLAPVVDPADVVTLDRVVCCYPDLDALLGTAAGKATRMVGLVYPRDTWWNRLAALVMNGWGWLTRDATRWYLHPTARVDGVMRRAGFAGRRPIKHSFIWQVVLYRRASAA